MKRPKPTTCQSVPQYCLTSCLWLSAPSPLVPTEDVNLKRKRKYIVSFLKQLLTVAFIKQTGGNSAFVGDYFQQRINTLDALLMGFIDNKKNIEYHQTDPLSLQTPLGWKGDNFRVFFLRHGAYRRLQELHFASRFCCSSFFFSLFSPEVHGWIHFCQICSVC